MFPCAKHDQKRKKKTWSLTLLTSFESGIQAAKWAFD